MKILDELNITMRNEYEIYLCFLDFFSKTFHLAYNDRLYYDLSHYSRIKFFGQEQKKSIQKT